jgi:sRNA-binding carbon storage regulator CsrA
MLCLTRGINQELLSGNDIIVRIVEFRGRRVRIGIRPRWRGGLRTEIADPAVVARVIAGKQSPWQAIEAANEAKAEQSANAETRHEAEERESAEWQLWAEADLATVGTSSPPMPAPWSHPGAGHFITDSGIERVRRKRSPRRAPKSLAEASRDDEHGKRSSWPPPTMRNKSELINPNLRCSRRQ